MTLFNIKKKLYKEGEEKELREFEEGIYNPASEESKPGEKGLYDDAWEKKRKLLGVEEKKAIKKGTVALISILGIIFLTVAIYKIRQIIFQEGKVTVSISGPAQGRSGQDLFYKIICQNDNTVGIKNITLRISYPEDFKPDEISGFSKESATSGIFKVDEIKGHAKKEIIFSGKGYSPRGALIYIKSDLLYTSKSFTGKFEAKNQLGVAIISTPINLEVEAPQNAFSGDQVNYLISYQNKGEEVLEGLKLKMFYPKGFSFSSSDPKTFEGNNVWYLGDIAPGQSGKIVATGNLSGEREEIKNFKVQIGRGDGEAFISYNEEQSDTKISSSPLTISQTVNNLKDLNVSAGDNLKFEILFSNNGNIGLRDVIIKEKIESPVLDYESLKMEGGSFDYETRTIIWKASDILKLEKLEPGEQERIIFFIKVKNNLPVSGENDKNFIITSLASIDSPDVPTPVSMNKVISSNAMKMKVNSKLVFGVSGYYNDSVIPNSGPIPPKVNQETTYTLHWKVANVSNDVTDARVEAFLPTNAVATGKIFPENAPLEYNSRTNSITWKIGNMKSGVGIINAPWEVVFQVKIKPSPEQVKQSVDILKESTFSARDTFTGENLKVSFPTQTTELRDDSLKYEDGRVEP